MRNIIIVDALSTGSNYVEDIVRRGYHPIVLETQKHIPAKYAKLVKAKMKKLCDVTYDAMYHKPKVIHEQDTYEATLNMVRELDPLVILPGTELGVNLANRLGEDLGLPANPTAWLPAMTQKDKMHEALKKNGLRYIRGRKVKSVEEAMALCEEFGLETAVVKPLKSHSSQGLFLCDSREEIVTAVKESLTMMDIYVKPIHEVLVQERIMGREYVVNTVSAAGIHRINDIWVYTKERNADGGNIYDYAESINTLNAGINELANYALKVADAIHFQNGVIHGEYMIDENGPVLIEVNCRPMGFGAPAEFLDEVQGHHETDDALDAVLNPELFRLEKNKSYRLLRKGYIKTIIVPNHINAKDYPLWEVAKQLKSVCRINAPGPSAAATRYPKTRDLETNGGVFFMVHDDQSVVNSELGLVRDLERNFFQLLLSDGKMAKSVIDRSQCPRGGDIATVIKDCNCNGAILVATDNDMVNKADGIQCVSPDTLADAHKGFDCVLIAYEKSLLGLTESVRLKLLFDTMELVKHGGKVIIPASTYQYITYDRKGAEMLMRIKGLNLELQTCNNEKYVIGMDKP